MEKENVSYFPGNELLDFLLGGKNPEIHCGLRCLETSDCMAMDICDVTDYPRCRLWTTLPDVSSTNTYICRRFFEITTKFLQVTTPQTVSIQTTSNSIPQTTSDLSSQTTTLLIFQAQTVLESAIQTTTSADTTTAIATTTIDMNCAEGCDCLPITNKFGPESEQYPVTLDGNNVSYVCKLISGEVWTVIQRRINGVIDFHSKLWTEYEAGFGSNSNEFWIGLKEIHRLTSVGLTKIRINLGFEDGSDGYAQYSHFTVGGTDTDYMLTISGYSGTAGDMMITTDSDVNLNGMKFSTIDRDNDHYSSGSCAAYYKGAWWFKYCTLSNLNALYNDFNNFAWGPHPSQLTKTMMMIKKP